MQYRPGPRIVFNTDEAQRIADQLESALKDVGVPIRAHGRIAQACHLLRRWSDGSNIRSREAPRLASVLREVLVLDTIAGALPAIGHLEGARALLTLFQQDSLDSRKSTRDAPGRNSQFHLYLASIMCQAGYAVTFEEPDLVVGSEYGKFQIAAKRILRSASRLPDRFEEGANQLRQNSGFGIVALDVANLLSPEGTALPLVEADTSLSSIVRRFEPVLDQWARLLMRDASAFEGWPVTAVLFYWMPIVSLPGSGAVTDWIATSAHCLAKFHESSTHSLDLLIAGLDTFE